MPVWYTLLKLLYLPLTTLSLIKWIIFIYAKNWSCYDILRTGLRTPCWWPLRRGTCWEIQPCPTILASHYSPCITYSTPVVHTSVTVSHLRLSGSSAEVKCGTQKYLLGMSSDKLSSFVTRLSSTVWTLTALLASPLIKDQPANKFQWDFKSDAGPKKHVATETTRVFTLDELVSKLCQHRPKNWPFADFCSAFSLVSDEVLPVFFSASLASALLSSVFACSDFSAFPAQTRTNYKCFTCKCSYFSSSKWKGNSRFDINSTRRTSSIPAVM